MIKGNSFRSHLKLFISDELNKTEDFEVQSVKVQKDEVILTISHFVRGASIYAYSKERWNQIPLVFGVVSGGWYGDDGRWSLHNIRWMDLIFEGIWNLKEEPSNKEECLSIKKRFWLKGKKAILVSGGKKYSFRFLSMKRKTNCMYGYDVETEKWMLVSDLYELRKEFLLSLR